MRVFWIACLSIAMSVAAQFSLKAGMGNESVNTAMQKSLQLRTLVVALGRPEIASFAAVRLPARMLSS